MLIEARQLKGFRSLGPWSGSALHVCLSRYFRIPLLWLELAVGRHSFHASETMYQLQTTIMSHQVFCLIVLATPSDSAARTWRGARTDQTLKAQGGRKEAQESCVQEMVASGPARKSSFVLPKSLSLTVPNVSTGPCIFEISGGRGCATCCHLAKSNWLLLFTTTAGVALLRAAPCTVEDLADP